MNSRVRAAAFVLVALLPASYAAELPPTRLPQAPLTQAHSSQAPLTQAPSLYDLRVQLTDQNGKQQPLDLYHGHPVAVVMFYASCPNACPLLIESVRANESRVASTARTQLRVLLVSIDPKRDTPEALAKLARDRRIDTAHWTLATAAADDVRLLAAALGVQYRQLPDGEFNHTSVITLIAPNGAILMQTSNLGRADPALVRAIEAAAHKP